MLVFEHEPFSIDFNFEVCNGPLLLFNFLFLAVHILKLLHQLVNFLLLFLNHFLLFLSLSLELGHHLVSVA